MSAFSCDSARSSLARCTSAGSRALRPLDSRKSATTSAPTSLPGSSSARRSPAAAYMPLALSSPTMLSTDLSASPPIAAAGTSSDSLRCDNAELSIESGTTSSAMAAPMKRATYAPMCGMSTTSSSMNSSTSVKAAPSSAELNSPSACSFPNNFATLLRGSSLRESKVFCMAVMTNILPSSMGGALAASSFKHKHSSFMSPHCKYSCTSSSSFDDTRSGVSFGGGGGIGAEEDGPSLRAPRPPPRPPATAQSSPALPAGRNPRPPPSRPAGGPRPPPSFRTSPAPAWKRDEPRSSRLPSWCACAAGFAAGSALRMIHRPRRRSMTSCSMKRKRLARPGFALISFIRVKYSSMCVLALAWSMSLPMVVISLHRHSTDSSSGCSMSPSSLIRHSCMIFSVSMRCLYSSPMNRMLPSVRRFAFL
mmetsp:Transcript_59502/g.136467  ORF Transcript_59502/g.136467 Transcript_59502/m.136467 type:complete len:421 (-) Transcript_59502:2522-3784(-)